MKKISLWSLGLIVGLTITGFLMLRYHHARLIEPEVMAWEGHRELLMRDRRVQLVHEIIKRVMAALGSVDHAYAPFSEDILFADGCKEWPNSLALVKGRAPHCNEPLVVLHRNSGFWRLEVLYHPKCEHIGLPAELGERRLKLDSLLLLYHEACTAKDAREAFAQIKLADEKRLLAIEARQGFESRLEQLLGERLAIVLLAESPEYWLFLIRERLFLIREGFEKAWPF